MTQAPERLVPIAGVYKFYYSIRQSGSAGTAAYARIQKNGSDISSGYGAVYLSTTRDQGSGEALIKLNVGDTIRVYLRNFSIAAHYNSLWVNTFLHFKTKFFDVRQTHLPIPPDIKCP